MYTIDGCCESVPFVCLNGEPVQRTPYTHPYSYDEFLVYKAVDFSEMDTVVYADRLYQWNACTFKCAYSQVWPKYPNGRNFHNKLIGDIERFLQLYYQRDVHLTAVLQGCNMGNGYPYWVFFFRYVC